MNALTTQIEFSVKDLNGLYELARKRPFYVETTLQLGVDYSIFKRKNMNQETCFRVFVEAVIEKINTKFYLHVSLPEASRKVQVINQEPEKMQLIILVADRIWSGVVINRSCEHRIEIEVST